MAMYYYERVPPHKPTVVETVTRFVTAVVGGCVVGGIAVVFFALAAPFFVLLGIAVGIGTLVAMVAGDYVSFTSTSSTVTELDERGVPQTRTRQKSWVRTNNPELRRQLEQRSAAEPDNAPKVLRWWERAK